MTPVDATSTCSTGQPTSRGRLGRHLARDLQALVAGARVRAAAVDDDRPRDAAGPRKMLARDDDRRRLRAVGREHRGRRRRAVRHEQREVEPPLALMPALTPAARKPCGVVTPPEMRCQRIQTSKRSCVTDGDGRVAVDRLGRAGIERQHHRVLAALPEQRALHAVGEDLLGQPEVRHDREAHLDEVARRVRERAELVEAFAPRAPPQLVDEHRADAAAAGLRVDGQRAHLGDLRAERRQLGAADDRPAAHRDDESRGVQRELVERPRQQMAFVEVRGDERVQRRRLATASAVEA